LISERVDDFCRPFKSFYQGHACRYLRAEFPKPPSYQHIPRHRVFDGKAERGKTNDRLMAGIVAYCLSDNTPSLSLIHVNTLTKV